MNDLNSKLIAISAICGFSLGFFFNWSSSMKLKNWRVYEAGEMLRVETDIIIQGQKGTLLVNISSSGITQALLVKP